MRFSNETRRDQGKTAARLRIVCAVLSLLPAVSLFFPYAQFLFRKTTYNPSGFTLMTAQGFWVEGPQSAGLVTIPLLIRIAVAGGAVLAILGGVLLLLKKPALAGAAHALSAITPLMVLVSTSSIQEAVTSLNISEVRVGWMWPFVLTLVLGLLNAVLSLWTRGTEKLAESIFLAFSCVAIGSVAMITIYVVAYGGPAIFKIGAGEFLFGTKWAAESELFGILPMILSSIAGTGGAILIGVPVGILTAIFLSETARKGVARIVRPAVQLLAGIPSVIYGFFGMLVIVPAIRNFPPFVDNTTGSSLLAAILILAIMVLPTIVSVSETALRAVPEAYREASLALGATPTTTIFKVTVPAARSGILAGVILGVGRAIGETMAVIMVAGNVPNMPQLLGPVRLLTTGIAMEMSYSSGLHREALFAIGLVLFVFIMIVNVSFTYISKRGTKLER